MPPGLAPLGVLQQSVEQWSSGVIINTSTEMDNEYVLIKISQHRVSFKDHQEARRTDDFDVSLILSYDGCSIGKSEK